MVGLVADDERSVTVAAHQQLLA